MFDQRIGQRVKRLSRFPEGVGPRRRSFAEVTRFAGPCQARPLKYPGQIDPITFNEVSADAEDLEAALADAMDDFQMDSSSSRRRRRRRRNTSRA
jgi:hypothetical protein